MAIDKEFMVKHRFWLLLATSAFLVAIGIFILAFPVRSGLRATEAEIQKRLDKIKNYKNFKSPQAVEQKRKEQGEEKAKETEVWKAAWKTHGNVSTWPAEFEQEFQFKDGWFAVDIV